MTSVQTRLVIICAGALPVAAALLAWQINVSSGLAACQPFWDGCISVSRAIRSGPGLHWFKALALPSCAVMVASWWLQQARLSPFLGQARSRHRLATWMGIAGALFFLVYALYLGVEGETYRWMRRYGVVFYFGLSGLAHLLLASALWNAQANRKSTLRQWAVNAYVLEVTLTWLAGIGSAFKRQLIDDAVRADRLENALEWNFALLLCLGFLALALVLPGEKAHGDSSSQASASGKR